MLNNNNLIAHQCINCGKTWEVALADAKQVLYKDDKMIIYNQCPVCRHTAESVQENKND